MTTLLRKMWKNQSKHKKLCEEWALAECDESEGWWGASAGVAADGVVPARYAGSAAVERAASAPATAKAVASALHVAKETSRKMLRVNISISSGGVLVTNCDTAATVLDISIHRISFCTADAARARVFALVEGCNPNEHLAHVFVCSRRKQARSLALALAHAFNDAYLAWQSQQDARATCSPAPPARTAALTLHHHHPPHDPWVAFDGESDSDSEEGSKSAWSETLQPTPLLSFN